MFDNCSLKELFNCTSERVGILFAMSVLNDLAILIYEELGKVPWDNISLLFLLIIQITLRAQKFIHVNSFSAIDIALFKHREFDFVSCLCPFLDFLISSRLLATKLITRERINI